MRLFVAQRTLILVPTFLGVTLFSFLLIQSIPGDPVLVMLGEHATAEEHERLSRLLGLDEPLAAQYGRYLYRLLLGDWGTTIRGDTQVFPLVIRRLWVTLELVIASTVIAGLLGILLGALSGLLPNSIFDKFVRGTTLFAFSIPTFWLGLVLILIFAVWLDWFPSLGRGTLSHMVMPVATLAAWQLGLIARTARISVIDTLSQDFIVTARGKGLGVPRITLRHILPNSIIPVITIIGLQFGGLIGGAVVTEVVFSYPGLGLLIVNNIFARDYPVVQGAIVLSAVAFMIINFASDLAYAWLDPRIRRQGA